MAPLEGQHCSKLSKWLYFWNRGAFQGESLRLTIHKICPPAPERRGHLPVVTRGEGVPYRDPMRHAHDQSRTPMKIALVGTGQMGQTVATVAPERGHDIEARFHSDRPFLEASPTALEPVDIAIDFSLPSLALPHLRRYCEWDVPVVMGTTGWYDALDDVRALVDRHDASVLYAPNFSVGVAVLSRALDHVTHLMNELGEYDAFVREMHHTRKVDSPSGTAQKLGEQIVAGLERKDHIEPETQHQRIDPSAVHVTSTRVGTVFGTHTIGFDSPFDRITLEHQAKNRRGFAVGALKAADWLQGRVGLFSLDDMLDDWLDT